ncbi:glutamine--tRNA ligase/YqeY domain fusion protein [Spongiibacter marinus]|jgi:glutaminyl-tRNA synthetase|uniref:glutamine--tRNA ligase/YqeY domain fusion protein n=1 Tax=Spongiibacter marinus TaxID=354246 RepID=UPI0019603189|nr:glutamine--tRNA ligase/YqeY domain fusion protein [Spongiibacter marinus]MBM7423703.1 glutaminyl-tRNA synthetase [Spongiibacter marinus]MEE2652209.1 glutamine--tRNA ligase/YqeY domain fusion protein [Pseudomonadota bacterium]
MSEQDVTGNNFLRGIIRKDIEEGRLSGSLVTRFPPEPNGFLHIGHAKSICLNFGLAEHFGGQCHLRFDDTNPAKEEQAYIDAIQEDIQWLGYQWAGPVRYASDYFDTLYDYAVALINAGKAYVCELSAEQAREYRGTLTEPGRNSPFRERSPEENLAEFEAMRNGEYEEGAKVLRAKIDMSAPNINLRDPIIYRIRKQTHHQTGDKWCIYPTYDFTHGQSDAIEGITHSICTLEFEDHRPLYEWFIENLPVPAEPKQYEFARLNINYTVTSKRKLKALVDENIVAGWDDPRMPTIAGMRRRGFTPAALRHFCEMVGVARSEGIVDMAMLEHAIRDDLDKNAPRAMCVMDPLKLVIHNYPQGQVEQLGAPGHPNRDDLGERQLPFTREVYIERDDFREEANKKFKRLVLGKKVRLRNAYVLLAEQVVKDEQGNIVEVHCSYDPDTLGADPSDGVKPKGVIHWVSASEGRRATVRIYDRLFNHASPDRGGEDFLEHVNPDSLSVVEDCWIEPGLANCAPESRFQFERTGYFVADRYEHSAEQPVFNRTIALRDSWGKAEA